jgi:hypothetical protein
VSAAHREFNIDEYDARITRAFPKVFDLYAPM